VHLSTVGTPRSLQRPIHDSGLPGLPTQLAYPPRLLVTPAADIRDGALVPFLVPLRHQIRALHHHAPAFEFPTPLPGTLRAVAADGGAVVRRCRPHTPAPWPRAPPFVLLLAAAQRDVRGGGVVLVPLRRKTFVSGHGAAAAE
jgi:hypothetical protein